MKIHMVSASDRQAVIFRLSGDHAHDAPEGHALLDSWDEQITHAPPVMDRAYEGDEIRRLVEEMGMTPVVPPRSNRKVELNCDRETYKFRNEVERLFRKLKGSRLIFTRFDKIDMMFAGFLNFALVVEMIYGLA